MPLSAPAPAPAPDNQPPHPTHDPTWSASFNDPFRFASRRSAVHSTTGMVACTQPLAAQCGLEVLRLGGNAADAAVAVSAGLALLEPCQTGIGGDMFLLYRSSSTGLVSALNGSGRAPAAYTLDAVLAGLRVAPDDDASSSAARIPWTSPLSVTVPGAAAGWVDTLERFGSGRVGLGEVLAPAIRMAEEGVPLSEIVCMFWNEAGLCFASPNYAELLKPDPSAPDGFRAPRPGEVFRNPSLASVLRDLAAHGKCGFYTGRVADAIVDVVAQRGGLLTHADLREHMDLSSGAPDPVALRLTGFGLTDTSAGRDGALDLWEHPPNGQGIVALMAAGILQALEEKGKATFSKEDFLTTPYLHAIIEALRIAFSDGNWYITDQDTNRVPVKELVSPEYLASRAELFDASRAQPTFSRGNPVPDDKNYDDKDEPSPALRSSDTVYFAVVDREGNAASFINSNYDGFGTHMVPKGCGFPIQSRGHGFSLQRGHPNVIAPRKRPYHTIIPGMVTHAPSRGGEPGELHSVFGVMGGYMQPQGHVQVLLAQIVGGLDAQQALDAPRVCVHWASGGGGGGGGGWRVDVEDGLDGTVVEGLRALGHNVRVVRGKGRSVFGRGQIIRRHRDPVEGRVVWTAGSDPRGDGAAYPAY